MFSVNIEGLGERRKRAEEKAERSIVKHCLAISVGFITFWTPYHVTTVWLVLSNFMSSFYEQLSHCTVYCSDPNALPGRSWLELDHYLRVDEVFRLVTVMLTFASPCVNCATYWHMYTLGPGTAEEEGEDTNL